LTQNKRPADVSALLPACVPGLNAKIVVLTGAGVSAESGLTPFRGPGIDDALWDEFDFHQVATPEAFAHDPAHVHAFYNLRRAAAAAAKPNAAHLALAELEKGINARGGSFILITQNVDSLHRDAGSETIIPMHGTLTRNLCVHCGARTTAEGPLSVETECPRCGTPGGLRPDVVWFGETPRGLGDIDTAMASATLFVSIGTSGTVYPAAGLVAEAASRGTPTLELCLEPSANAALFTAGLYGNATTIVPAWVEAMIAKPDHASS